MSSREEFFERPLPNSSEAERAILGAILLDNGLISETMAQLKPEMFYVPSHRRIYNAMCLLSQKGSEINPILIGEELKKENALESVGGITFIINLTYGLPHSTNITNYIKVVVGKAYLRDLIKTSQKIIAEALEEDDDPEVIGEHAEAAIFALQHNKTQESEIVGIYQIAESILNEIQQQEGKANFLLGLTTGFTDLDQLLSGLQKKELIILAARPSMGKTACCLMMAENAAIEADAVVLIFSVEMSKEALVMRSMSSQTNINAQRIRNNFLSRAEWSKLGQVLNVYDKTRIFFDDTAALTTMQMRNKMRRVIAEQKKLDLVIVDYMQLMSGSGKKSESRQQEVSQISRELKALAKEFDVPLLALSQLSRAPESRSDHRPQLSDLRDSGQIEQDADVVMFIYREEVYKTQDQREAMPEDQRNIAEIIVAKQRNGPTDTVKLRFNPACMRFDNLYSETPKRLDFSST